MSDNIYIDKDAVVEEGAVVFPNNYIGAGSVIKSGAILRPNNIIENSVVEEGAVVTAEPGIYIPGAYGIRIEDMVLVRNDGCANLTLAPKQLEIL